MAGENEKQKKKKKNKNREATGETHESRSTTMNSPMSLMRKICYPIPSIRHQ